MSVLRRSAFSAARSRGLLNKARRALLAFALSTSSSLRRAGSPSKLPPTAMPSAPGPFRPPSAPSGNNRRRRPSTAALLLRRGTWPIQDGGQDLAVADVPVQGCQLVRFGITPATWPTATPSIVHRRPLSPPSSRADGRRKLGAPDAAPVGRGVGRRGAPPRHGCRGVRGRVRDGHRRDGARGPGGGWRRHRSLLRASAVVAPLSLPALRRALRSRGGAPRRPETPPALARLVARLLAPL